jgi:CheY-like chemotaxis protein
MQPPQVNRESRSATPSAGAPGASPASLGGRPVLLIEDDEDARDVLELMLRACGAAPQTAATGEEGLALLEREHFDAVICDLSLPGIDGLEVARRIRAAPAGKPITLIVLTGFSQTGDVQRATEAGFDAHLTKPVEPERLVRLLLEASPPS